MAPNADDATRLRVLFLSAVQSDAWRQCRHSNCPGALDIPRLAAIHAEAEQSRPHRVRVPESLPAVGRRRASEAQQRCALRASVKDAGRRSERRAAPSSRGLRNLMHLRTGTDCAESQEQEPARSPESSRTRRRRCPYVLAICQPKALLRTHPPSETCCAASGVLPPGHHRR